MKKSAWKNCSWMLLAIVIVCFFTIAIILLPSRETIAVLGPAQYQAQTLIIDAGHGGEDGGAISSNGVIESNINLAIARRLDILAGFYGVPSIMLRTDDSSLHDETARTLREKKVSDLHNRVAMISEVSNGTLISIHQNSYPNGKYSGAQVFYSNEALSASWAECTQELLRYTLNQKNQRLAKVIPDSIYLMNHISCPAILIECGFLSNSTEEQLLQSGSYQTKIAAAIMASYLQYW